MTEFRVECDSIGEKKVPIDAYYGVQTLRAHENFKISDTKTHKELIRAIVEIKKAAAITNGQAGVIEKNIVDAMVRACDELLSGKFLDNFITDAIQGGAGTSLNMNANEVIANRAIEILGGNKGDYTVVHPNDHANCGQSTNDAYPSAGKIAAIRLLEKATEALKDFYAALKSKAEQFNGVIKMGRTEMQDAVPISFGQSFNAYAAAVSRDIKRFGQAVNTLSTLNMGGTAIGKNINADKNYVKNIVPNLCKVTGLNLSQADDLVDAT
ncbi:MAG: aspartate ammonia-lyase, partial [Clostridia bacterium]|nr:aspartate ammonia-lyase [Clostridia bacterium]